MDIKQFMTGVGFGSAGSRLIIIEQDGKLWLAFASEGAGGFMMSSDALASGLLEIDLIHDGRSVPYTYESTESLIKITTEHGKVFAAMDTDACALRFDGDGVSVRFDSKNTAQPTRNLNMDNGTAISIGGGQFFFIAKRGQIAFDDSWDLLHRKSVPPILDISPHDGKFELIVYDLPEDAQAAEISKSTSECAAENAADFNAFCAKLPATQSEWDDLREKIAYLLWINQRNINGVDVILTNKLLSPELDAVKLSISSLMFECPTRASELILAGHGISPAAQASAVLRLFYDGLFKKVSRKTVLSLYKMLNEQVIWWTKNRTCDDPSLYFYAYRYEAGKPANALFKSGAPVYSPDINTYMILACEALSKLAGFIGDTAEVTRWHNRAAAILKATITNLWDGCDFVGKNVYSNETIEAGDQISFTPLALGDMLPGDISSSLAQKVGADICDPFIILGLYRAGYEKEAKEVVSAKLHKARETGVNNPSDGAALLSLAHHVL